MSCISLEPTRPDDSHDHDAEHSHDDALLGSVWNAEIEGDFALGESSAHLSLLAD